MLGAEEECGNVKCVLFAAGGEALLFQYKYKYKYNSYFYCAPYSLTDGALLKSANMRFTLHEITLS